MPNRSKRTLASPQSLPARNEEEQSIRVVVETPRGSRNKYKFDPDLSTYSLNRVLPEGMVFPYDFGFIPQTKADDGDPLDVLLIMDAPAFPGCLVDCRIIGVVEGEQTEEGETVRNDRLIAVPVQSHKHADLKNVEQLNETFINDLGEFFTNYHRLRGRTFKVLSVRGPKHAQRLLKNASSKRKAA